MALIGSLLARLCGDLVDLVTRPEQPLSFQRISHLHIGLESVTWVAIDQGLLAKLVNALAIDCGCSTSTDRCVELANSVAYQTGTDVALYM